MVFGAARGCLNPQIDSLLLVLTGRLEVDVIPC